VAHTHDDGFHEIQLNGKQLVFLVMAAMVVSTVIFLLGVLVGRGVRAERNAADSAAAMASEPLQAAPAPAVAPGTAPAADPTKAEPPLTYFELEKKNAQSEPLKAEKPADKPALEKPAAEKPAPQRSAAPRADKPEPTATAGDARNAEPGGSGYAVQIAALNVRSEADAIAKRLTSKGYSAYVLAPPSGSPSVFRVRVGKFPTRREAENVAAKLQKEEQFKPWVTR
jgi:cell division septation protein DedD